MRGPESHAWQIGAMLTQLGKLEACDISHALSIQKKCKILTVEPDHFISSIKIHRTLAEQYGMPFVDLDHFSIQYAALCSIPYRLIIHYLVMPIIRRENLLILAVSHPQQRLLGSFIGQVAKVDQVQMVMACPEAIEKQIESCYGAGVKAA